MGSFKSLMASLIALMVFISPMIYADETWYTVENASGGTDFSIANGTYVSKDYCFGVRTGDKVTFLEGGPGSYCETASFKVQRNGQVCEVTCH